MVPYLLADDLEYDEDRMHSFQQKLMGGQMEYLCWIFRFSDGPCCLCVPVTAGNFLCQPICSGDNAEPLLELNVNILKRQNAYIRVCKGNIIQLMKITSVDRRKIKEKFSPAMPLLNTRNVPANTANWRLSKWLMKNTIMPEAVEKVSDSIKERLMTYPR